MFMNTIVTVTSGLQQNPGSAGSNDFTGYPVGDSSSIV
jgi:hypothetical protein